MAMKFRTRLGTKLELTTDELRTIERATQLEGALAVDELVILMAEEMVWPDENTVKKYVGKLRNRV